MMAKEEWRIEWEKRLRLKRIYATKERRAKRIARDKTRARWPNFDFVKGEFRRKK